jgi:hypothetical protein
MYFYFKYVSPVPNGIPLYLLVYESSNFITRTSARQQFALLLRGDTTHHPNSKLTKCSVDIHGWGVEKWNQTDIRNL